MNKEIQSLCNSLCQIETRKYVYDRLEYGQKKYKKNLPKSDGRNYILECKEELGDALVYLLAEMIRYEHKAVNKDYKVMVVLIDRLIQMVDEQVNRKGSLK
jgi:hypothetical protein